MHAQAVRERIVANVAAFPAERVKDALALSALIASNTAKNMPTPSAYVLPLGVRAQPRQDASGLFIQTVNEIVGVVLAFRHAGDVLGAKMQDEITDTHNAIVAAVCGWAPEDASDVFQLVSAQLISLAAGLALYQIEFAIPSQLRLPLSE